MRKFTAIFLALVIVCGLFGCAREPQEQDSKPRYSVTDLMIGKAVEITRQMGMRADAGFLTALEFPAEVASMAGIFREAVDAENITAKVETAVLDTLPTDITALCSQFGGSTQVACCGALTESNQIFMAKELEYPTAVYLRYSESCHFVVVFTPLGDNLASVWAYPLFAKVAEQVLERYFSDAEDLDADQVRDACNSAADALYEAQCTDQKTSADYYIQLANTVIKDVKPLSDKDISKYTSEQKILANAATMSRLMYSGISSALVYRYPGSLQSQIDEALSSTEYSQQLKTYARRQFCLTYPNQISNRYGEDWMVVNAILATELDTAKLSAIASEDEEPVLVLMNLSGTACLLMSIYPSEYNIYLYSYAVLPVSYREVQTMLTKDGAVRMK